MILLLLTLAEARVIRDALPAGRLQTILARELTAIIHTPALPELVVARPRDEYLECCYDRATADRCWRAFVRAFRAPSPAKKEGR